MTSDGLTPSELGVPELEKRAVGIAGAQLVEDGMIVGLGTGSTVAFLLIALAPRRLDIRCVATSPRTEEAGRRLGLTVEPFGSIDRFDIAIDGADEVTPEGWLIKGGGAAHTREKIVAAAADRFVVIADSSKAVEALTWPVPIELLDFGLTSTLRRLGSAVVRDVPLSPDGGVIADYHCDLDDPDRIAALLSGTPGLVDHGLFAPTLVHDVLVARGTEVTHRRLQ
ncbi:MAG: ribose 5-phosphate isomerase A [Nakamurella sp.]